MSLVHKAEHMSYPENGKLHVGIIINSPDKGQFEVTDNETKWIHFCWASSRRMPVLTPDGRVTFGPESTKRQATLRVGDHVIFTLNEKREHSRGSKPRVQLIANKVLWTSQLNRWNREHRLHPVGTDNKSAG